MIIGILILAIWILCGIIGSGIYLAYFQKKWPSLAEENYNRNVSHSLILILFGPIALFVALGSYGTKYGIMFPFHAVRETGGKN